MRTIRVRRNPDPVQTQSPASREAAESILKTAIEAHMQWKESLERYVEGCTRLPPALDMGFSDDCCLLGKWLHVEGNNHFGHMPVFRSLVQAHAEFHRQAAIILAFMHQGQAAEAMQYLRMGNYPKSSAQVKELLARLCVEILCQHSRPSRLAGYC